jgi:hypothetical protein
MSDDKSAQPRFHDLIARRDVLIIYPFLWIVLIAGIVNTGLVVWTWIVSLWASHQAGNYSALAKLPLETLLLPLLAVLGLYIIHERRIFIERLGSDLSKKLVTLEASVSAITASFGDAVQLLINSLNAAEFKSFDSEIALKRYLNQRALGAEHNIDDLTWAHNRPQTTLRRSPEQQTEWDRLENEYENSIRSVARTRTYREVFILSRPSRVEKLKRRHQEKSAGYLCRVLPDSPIPRLQFVIIDRREIIFISGNHQVFCAIKHPGLVKLFADHYEEIWESASPLVRMENGRAAWDEDAYNRIVSATQEHSISPPN